MQTTSIEWTDMSVNPFRARDGAGHTGHYCEKVSAGCTHCYASAMQVRFQMPTFPEARKQMPELYLKESKLMDVLRRKKPTRIFWCDMTDMFADFYPDEWIDKCFAVMALTPQHTHQVLTKRPERMNEYMAESDLRLWDAQVNLIMELADSHTLMPEADWPLPNVWLGVSVEDQATADERIPLLLQTPAAVRWISAEPLLTRLDLVPIFSKTLLPPHARFLQMGPSFGTLDWVVVGGESGPKARWTELDWIRSIVEQTAEANVPCFVKQVGQRVIAHGVDGTYSLNGKSHKGGDMSEWPEDLRVREWPEVAR